MLYKTQINTEIAAQNAKEREKTFTEFSWYHCVPMEIPVSQCSLSERKREISRNFSYVQSSSRSRRPLLLRLRGSSTSQKHLGPLLNNL